MMNKILAVMLACVGVLAAQRKPVDEAWDLLVHEYRLDPARMWFTVFEGDDEVGPDEDAEKFWEQVGAPRERILRPWFFCAFA